MLENKMIDKIMVDINIEIYVWFEIRHILSEIFL